MNARNRFTRGSGCYTCTSCRKKTRATGGNDNEHVGLCRACYERAGDENAVADGIMSQAEFDAKYLPPPADPAAGLWTGFPTKAEMDAEKRDKGAK